MEFLPGDEKTLYCIDLVHFRTTKIPINHLLRNNIPLANSSSNWGWPTIMLMLVVPNPFLFALTTLLPEEVKQRKERVAKLASQRHPPPPPRLSCPHSLYTRPQRNWHRSHGCITRITKYSRTTPTKRLRFSSLLGYSWKLSRNISRLGICIT